MILYVALVAKRAPDDTRRPCQNMSFLDSIRRENRRARREPLQAAIPADSVDRLDRTGPISFHHEGPYDSTLMFRQVKGRAPVDAVKEGNAATLQATPPGNLVDTLRQRIPLDGVGALPPGSVAPGGRVMDYEEENYIPTKEEIWDDGVERPRRHDKMHFRGVSDGGSGIELRERLGPFPEDRPDDRPDDKQRRESVSGRLEKVSTGLKKRTSIART